VIVIFLPGGLMEGFARIWRMIQRRRGGDDSGAPEPAPAPAE
jgi:hypothetical protein